MSRPHGFWRCVGNQQTFTGMPTTPPTVFSPDPPRARTPAEQAIVDAWRKRGRASTLPKVRMEGKEITPALNDYVLWVAHLSNLMQTEDYDFLSHLISQGAHCVWQAESDRGLNCTIAGVASIAPRDPLEALLAIQMVSVHNVG